jgi:hypothetical protein
MTVYLGNSSTSRDDDRLRTKYILGDKKLKKKLNVILCDVSYRGLYGKTNSLKWTAIQFSSEIELYVSLK